MSRTTIAASAVLAMLLAAPAKADPITDGSNVFVFGGLFEDEFVWETAVFWRPHYENNAFLGAGYQNFFADLPANFHVGVEVGVGARVGELCRQKYGAGSF